MSTKIIATAPIGEYEGYGDGFTAEAAFKYARENPKAQYAVFFPGDIDGLECNIAVIYEGDDSMEAISAALSRACPDAFGDEEGA